jgi:hypothetical protein
MFFTSRVPPQHSIPLRVYQRSSAAKRPPKNSAAPGTKTPAPLLGVDEAAVAEVLPDVDPPLLADAPSTPPCTLAGMLDLLVPAAALLNWSSVWPLALHPLRQHGARKKRDGSKRGSGPAHGGLITPTMPPWQCDTCPQ